MEMCFLSWNHRSYEYKRQRLLILVRKAQDNNFYCSSTYKNNALMLFVLMQENKCVNINDTLFPIVPFLLF